MDSFFRHCNVTLQLLRDKTTSQLGEVVHSIRKRMSHMWQEESMEIGCHDEKKWVVLKTGVFPLLSHLQSSNKVPFLHPLRERKLSSQEDEKP